jgi:hypothetical protein
VAKRIQAFAAFWYDFLIGDDWLVAAGVAVSLGLTYWVSQTAVPAWWLMPVFLLLILPVSLWRGTRRG